MVDCGSKHRRRVVSTFQRTEGEGQRVLISEYPPGTFTTLNPRALTYDLNSKPLRFKGDRNHIPAWAVVLFCLNDSPW